MQEATGLSTHLQQPPLRPPEGWLCSRVNSVHVPLLQGLSIFALLPQGDKGSGEHPEGGCEAADFGSDVPARKS